MKKVISIFGTRPEAIKIAPIIKELEKYSDKIKSVVCVTAQHRQMLDQVLQLFEIVPDIDLDLMVDDQTLTAFTVKSMIALSDLFEKIQPDLALVQGDTSTAMLAALVAFYKKVPVGHVEAGLRTANRYSPFPEEINRRLISVLATYHFAPTRTAADALRKEGWPDETIYITGNTVIDALLMIAQKEYFTNKDFIFPQNEHKLILVTAHRRENFGKPIRNICQALKEIVHRNSDVEIAYPVHLNPNIRLPVYEMLAKQDRVHLLEPMEYLPFVQLMKRAYLVLTDSGGIQEEAPALGKPVLVMRQETERPEAVEAGTAKIVGTNSACIISETELLLNNQEEYVKMANAVSPYGDGYAAQRIIEVILNILNKQ